MPLLIRMLKLVDRHIFGEWLKIFSLTLAATLGLLILNEMYGSFGDLVDYRASARQAVRYYGVLVPSFLPVVLPLALLLSLLFSLGNFHRNNELVAYRAGGLSIGRITFTLWVAGAVVSALLLLLNARVVPWSVEESRRVWDNIEFTHLTETGELEARGVINNLAFDNRQDGRLWKINRFSPHTYRGFGVDVHVLDDERRPVFRILAREAHYEDFRREWVFTEGRLHTYDAETGDLLSAPAFQTHVERDYGETPDLLLLVSKRTRDLSLNELRLLLGIVDPGDPIAASLAVRYHAIMAASFSGLIIVALAIPFATTGVRVNPMVGVSKSIGLFAFYYLIDNVSRILGEQGALDPLPAAWLPLLVMAVVALLLLRRTS